MRARVGVAALVAVALLAVAVFVPGASAAAASSPLGGLTQARSQLGALAGSARTVAARKLLGAAQSDLASATAPSLFIDPSHTVAPAYGLAVFAGSRAALRALEGVSASAVPSGAIAGVEASVLSADRRLALGEMRQAAGGPAGGLLARARGMILSGDRWSETSRVDLGAVQYGSAWRWAFEALRMTVELRAELVSPVLLGAAAENALGRASIAPTGVRTVSGEPPLSGSGKPEVLFVGTQSCRFCAVERWGLVAALSQFGTFSLLGLSQSATTEHPVFPTLNFHGSSYDSFYVSFDPVELTSPVPRAGGGYQPLDRLTPSQGALVHSLDPTGTAPFIDVANQFADVGATLSPTPLAGSTWGTVSASLRGTKTPTGLAIAATAEVITAEICHATGGVPTPVCSTPAVQDYASRLASYGGRGGGCPIPLRKTRRQD